MCHPFIVRHAETILGTSKAFLGETITNAVVRRTFFGHFCGGEDADSIKPAVERLAKLGVGSILEYAAESDIEEPCSTTPTAKQERSRIICRKYTEEDEAACDKNADLFKQAIRVVKDTVDTGGTTAIKITALGPPELLLRLATFIVEMRKFFDRMDLDKDGVITCEDWTKGCQSFFEGSEAEYAAWFDRYRKPAAADPDCKGIDLAEWMESMTLEELLPLLARCKLQGPLAAAQLEDGELKLLASVRERANSIAAEAKLHGIRLLVDAEHTYFQPAIDLVANELMRSFNPLGEQCTVFNTYQAYLKDTEQRLATDMERARRLQYGFAAKVVRGAYVELETAHAKKCGLPNPIHDCIEDTHASYDRCIAKVLEAVKPGGGGAECMVATHNQASVETALALMEELGLGPQDQVYFGQLLGMCDHLTITLGRAGFSAYKVVPWGPVNEVTPYLLRRAQENSAIVGGAKAEVWKLLGELARRVRE